MSAVPPPPGPPPPPEPPPPSGPSPPSGPPPPPPGPEAAHVAHPAAPGPSAKGEGLLETAVGVLIAPVATMRGLVSEPRVGWAVILTVVLALISAVETAGVAGSQAPVAFGPDGPPGPPQQLRWVMLVGGAIFLPLIGLGVLAVWSAILHGVARLLGGVGRYGTVFTTVGFANTPQVFTVLGTLATVTLGLPGQVLSWLLGLGLFLWTAVLSVIAVRESHRLSTGKAVAVYLIPIGVVIGLGILLAVLVIVLIVGGIGAALGVATP